MFTDTKRAGTVGAAPANERVLSQEKYTTQSADSQEIYEIAGRSYPVKGKAKYGDTYLPIVDIHLMSDYRWQLDCLKGRLKNPGLYRSVDPDVNERILQLIKWLYDNEANATPEELEEFLSLIHD